MTPFSLVAALVFFVSLLALAQTYVLYPLELWLLTSGDTEDAPAVADPPSVTLVVAAYNEEEIIEAKIQNSLDIDYPEEKLDVVVFSDASSDRTDDIVRGYADQGVELRRIEGRVGKTVCQNQVTADLSSDIVVFSDANSMYEADSIRRLVERFEDGVGCVVGDLRYRDDDSGESIYWRYERQLRRLESRFHSLVSGNGAIYAVRRESYVPLPHDEISDFAELLAIARNGERIEYAPEAVAVERTESSVEGELDRRIRIVNRSVNTLLRYRDLLNPIRHPKFSFQLWSHKLLRWLAPLALLGALGANVALALSADSWAFDGLLAGQLLCYGLAGVGALASRLGVETPLFVRIPHYFVVSNYGVLAGLLQYLRRGPIVTWETTGRDEKG